MSRMMLLTKKNRADLPPLYANDGKPPEAVKVAVKFFNPAGAGTWFATEFDGVDTFFGYVTGLGSDELGYFSLTELASFKGRFGLGIERDRPWDENTTLDKVMSGECR